MNGWTEDKRDAIERAAKDQHPMWVRVVGPIIILMVAIPLVLLWAGAMMWLFEWVFG